MNETNVHIDCIQIKNGNDTKHRELLDYTWNICIEKVFAGSTTTIRPTGKC